MAKKLTGDLPALPDDGELEDISEDSEIAKLANRLSFRQKVWADAYIKTLNKKKASLIAGCTEANASTYGTFMYNKQNVREYIEHVIAASIGTIDDNIKFVQTIRDTSLGDYLTTTKIIKSDLIKVSLRTVIEQKITEAEMAEELFMEATEPKEITANLQYYKSLKREIRRLELELKYNPKAHRIIYGPEYLADHVELDLVKLSKDRENGLIKTFQQTKDGIKVELYSSLDAANTLAKIQGVDKSAAPVTNLNVGPTAEQLSKLSESDLKAMAAIEKKMKA